MDNLLKEEELENKIPGEEKENIEAETGTAESGSNEAATEDMPLEENGVGENSEPVNEPAPETEPEMEPEAEPEAEPEKMLPQSQVNELIGKARQEGRESAMRELYGRYGVNDDNEMNDIFGKGQGYDVLNEEYQGLNNNFRNLSAENALLKSGVVESRFDDVKAILEHKGLDVTVENIKAEGLARPEWFKTGNAEPAVGEKQVTMQDLEAMGQNARGTATPTETSTIRKLGSNAPETKVDLEKANALKMFGLSK